MRRFADSDLTRDGFLGGALQIMQPKSGYRAGTDPVFLAAAVPARAGQRVLELGCGVGVASLCLAHRVAALAMTGLEIQPAYADLAQKNAALNGLAMRVCIGDLANMPADIRQEVFDHVVANPPYFRAGHGTPGANAGKQTALREETPLSVWVENAVRRLKPKGHLTFIHRIGRLPQLLGLLDARVGGIVVLPLAARQGQVAERFLIRAQKGGRQEFCLLAPFVLHTGDAHDGDQENFSPAANAVLRAGAAIDFET